MFESLLETALGLDPLTEYVNSLSDTLEGKGWTIDRNNGEVTYSKNGFIMTVNYASSTWWTLSLMKDNQKLYGNEGGCPDGLDHAIREAMYLAGKETPDLSEVEYVVSPEWSLAAGFPGRFLKQAILPTSGRQPVAGINSGGASHI